MHTRRRTGALPDAPARLFHAVTGSWRILGPDGRGPCSAWLNLPGRHLHSGLTAVMTAEQRQLGRQIPGDRVHSVSVDTFQNAESCRCSLPLPSLVPADGGTIDIHAKTATPQDTTALADTPVACSPFNYPQPPMVPTCTQHTPTQARPPTAEATATRTHGVPPTSPGLAPVSVPELRCSLTSRAAVP